MNFEAILEKYQPSIDQVCSWCDTTYDTKFGAFFSKQHALYESMQSEFKPVTDEELEQILTEIPLQLFSVSEALSTFKLGLEVIKLDIKERSRRINEHSDTAAKQAELSSLAEDRIFLMAYGSIVERVEHEISFSRELIMSAKKIWDSRRKTDAVLPVSPGDYSNSLPEYNPDIGNRRTYIK